MEPNEKVEYYSKDFDWKTLEIKYQEYFSTKTTDFKTDLTFLENYEKNWESFYQMNQENFFKDRKYLLKSFEEILFCCEKNRKP